MSNYYGAPSYPSHVNSHSHNNHHGGRSRRAPRLSGSHNNHKQNYKPARSPKEVVEVVAMTSTRRDFDAARAFDLEDDELFCPFHLLTEDDLQSIHSSASDRSSLSSGSPEHSPLQHQLQPTPNFVLSSASSTTSFGSSFSQTKLHQPLAQRTRNAIPIVDPSTRAIASPPPSVSPARQIQSFIPRRW
ncbi:hypothetical protein M501DRAFT_1013499 [Patellaria atrata CBS 101060]|uniref:Uncharacterized protein n=1 Tax=Patellaria atrata CBS 101060 TaxID=1346257 RepID=A0A9P4SGA0_9PEZI|nr:hypothetical protein M501DRAFT_1013499 [Patellaria atrata CBS 101060]